MSNILKSCFVGGFTPLFSQKVERRFYEISSKATPTLKIAWLPDCRTSFAMTKSEGVLTITEL